MDSSGDSRDEKHQGEEKKRNSKLLNKRSNKSKNKKRAAQPHLKLLNMDTLENVVRQPDMPETMLKRKGILNPYNEKENVNNRKWDSSYAQSILGSQHSNFSFGGNSVIFPIQFSVPTMEEINTNVNAAVAAATGVSEDFRNLSANVAALTAALNASTAAFTAALNASTAANTAALNASTAANTAALNANTEALASVRDDVALANNRACGDMEHPLMPRFIDGAEGALPANFPATLNDLSRLTSAQVNAFINYWHVLGGVDGGVMARRSRLGAFLGVPRRQLQM